MRKATQSVRTQLTRWYCGISSATLIVFAAIVFAFQYITLKRQIVHDELQDVATVEGLLYVNASGQMQLHQDYFSRPQSHLLIDRLMEVRDLSGEVVYSSNTLRGQALGGSLKPKEGDGSYDERILQLNDGNRVLTISHVHGIAGKDYVIRLGYSLTPLRVRMWQFLILLCLALLLMVILTAWIGNFVTGKILKPLSSMTAHAAKISANDLHQRLSVGNPEDELGTLATAFNHLIERLEEAFEQLQRFTSDAAHELRAPLASIRTIGETSLSRPPSFEGYRETIGSLLEEANQLNETVDSLLLLARAEIKREERLELFPVALLVEEVLNVLSILAEERHVRLRFQNISGEDLLVRAERALLRVALMNVVHNAIKFSPEAGNIEISVNKGGEVPGYAEITVHDDGPGIPDEEMKLVFERFFTGREKPAGSKVGAGLGLSIAQLVLRRANGSISFKQPDHCGTLCVIQIPLASGFEPQEQVH